MICYGRTTNPDGSPIKPGQTTSKEKEDGWLNKRAASERAAVEDYAKKHGYDWSGGQKDALASFRYNVGNLDQLTRGGKRTNDEITQALPQYNKAGGQVSEGLVNRRNAELEMWGAKPKEQAAPPPAEAPPQVGFDPVQIAQQLAMPKQMMPMQAVGLRGRDPEYIESLAAGGVSTYNGGGPVQYLQDGGWLRKLFGGKSKSDGNWDEAYEAVPWIEDAYGAGVDGGQLRARSELRKKMAKGKLSNQEKLMLLANGYEPPRGEDGKYKWNEGGPVQYLRNGGRANITEEERERRRLARLAAANNVSRGRNQARGVPQMDVAPPPRTYQDTSVQPLPTQRDQNPYGSTQIGRHFGNIVNQQDNKQAWTVPQVDNQPPVPGTDEAVLQGSSQAVEEQEQYSPGGAGRGGAPIEQLSEEQIGMAYDAGDPRAIAYAENQDRQYQTDEALRQAQLQQSVTAPDAPDAPFINSRVQSLQDQMTNLGVPPESQGVGVQTNPASDPGIPNMAAPDMPLGPDDVGAVAGIDTEAPTPQEATDAVDPDRDDPRGKDQRAAPPAEQRTGIKNAQAASNETAPEVSESERADIVTLSLIHI